MLDKLLQKREYPLVDTFGLDPAVFDTSITVTGFEIPDPAMLTDPDEQAHAAYLWGAVPVADPLYEFRHELIADIYYWWMYGTGEVLQLWGPTGAGKTSVMNEWCARLGVPLFALKGHRDFQSHEAFGHFILTENGQTEWAPGPVTLAAQYGCPVIINEYDRIQASRAIVFNDVFESRAFPVPGKHGEVVSPREGFRTIITTNTNLVEDPTGNYATATVHDVSLLERLMSVRVDYPSADTERRILKGVLQDTGDDLLAYWFDQEALAVNTPSGMKEGSAISRDEFIDAAINVANAIRKQSKDGGSTDDAALERTMSTRILRRWVFHAATQSSLAEKHGRSALHHSLSRYLSGTATESTRIALHKAIETIFGVGETVR